MAIIGILLKIFLVTGGTLFIGLSLSALACIYYPLGFFFFNSIKATKIFKKEAYKGMSILRGIGSVFVGLILSITLVGILFKILDLEGSGFMLLTGLSCMSVCVSVLLIKYFRNRKVVFYRNMVFRTVSVWVISLILFLTPGTTLVKFFYRDNPEYVKAYIEASKNPENKELQYKAEEIRRGNDH